MLQRKLWKILSELLVFFRAATYTDSCAASLFHTCLHLAHALRYIPSGTSCPGHDVLNGMSSSRCPRHVLDGTSCLGHHVPIVTSQTGRPIWDIMSRMGHPDQDVQNRTSRLGRPVLDIICPILLLPLRILLCHLLFPLSLCSLLDSFHLSYPLLHHLCQKKHTNSITNFCGPPGGGGLKIHMANYVN